MAVRSCAAVRMAAGFAAAWAQPGSSALQRVKIATTNKMPFLRMDTHTTPFHIFPFLPIHVPKRKKKQKTLTVHFSQIPI